MTRINRETSIEAYRQLRESGALAASQIEALRWVAGFGPRTAGELIGFCGAPHGIWKRLSELRRMKLIEEVDKRPCKVTGKSAVVWQSTGSTYIAPSKPRTKPLAEPVQQPLAIIDRN